MTGICPHCLGHCNPLPEGSGYCEECSGTGLAVVPAQRENANPVGYISPKTLSYLTETASGTGPVVACAGYDTIIPVYLDVPAERRATCCCGIMDKLDAFFTETRPYGYVDDNQVIERFLAKAREHLALPSPAENKTDAEHFGDILRNEAVRLRMKADELDPPRPSQPETASEEDVASEIYAAEYDRETYPFADRHSNERLTYLIQAKALLAKFNVTRKTTEEPRG